MAQSFLATHGIDLDAELARLQTPTTPSDISKDTMQISNVTLPNTTHASDLTISSSNITSIKHHDPSFKSETTTFHSPSSALIAPSLCHPHIHLDKPYLLSHPRFAASQTIKEGTFAEAMTLTSQAKQNFTREDLLERGQRLLDESIEAGVTHVRAFVEVDAVVGTKCLDAGLELKADVAAKCVVQICAFAQVPIFSSSQGDEDGSVARRLLVEAVTRGDVEVIGSTPYVESDREKQEKNIEWMVDLAIEKKVHLDFHLDYNLDPSQEAMVWHVVKKLKEKKWNEVHANKTIVLGHCTRLSLFTSQEWKKLKEEIGDLPISFVGLPTSDLFMMRTPERTRGTLNVPEMIKTYGLNACIGVNNVGNAFTPQGSCDPLSLACSCIGIYSAGMKADAEFLYECVSTRARKAIGFGRVDGEDVKDARVKTELCEGEKADLVVFGSEKDAWRTRRSVSEAVYLYDHCRGRKAMLGGLSTT
jgi:cytosine/adenosine deaminase-related metal-dependent hydrolase